MADKILFGAPEENNPQLTRKLAHGTGTDAARTMTFQALITWLTSRLPFFNTANNLSEANAGAVRTNLSVNSIAENTAALALKADKSNVIEKNSTAAYTPTLATHPLNKAFYDNRRASGTVFFATPWNINSYDVVIGKIMPSFNYIVTLMSITENGFSGQYAPSIINRTTAGFTIVLSYENTSNLTEAVVVWQIEML